ncbi:MAG: GTPase HflX [Thalassospira sp.]|nr:GTPase HflX [Thalassospira sp.]
MIETAVPRARAIVLSPRLKADRKARGDAERLAEAVGLAAAIELDVVHSRAVVIDRARPSHIIGSGVIEEVAALVKEHEVTLIVMDGAVSPIQQRNLERDIGAKVIDRTGLILEIFGARALTHEGQLQVELAALTYQKGRLVRSWTHLERQRGGFGFMGGPGESQLEIDRRLIQGRIERLEKDLANVRRTRGLHRRKRADVPYPVVALVGYTNAGKSTLFNRLSGADVLVKDMLFATLDPTVRAIKLANGQTVMLSDTVGFISDLPTLLVAAFRATLEEVLSADIIVHVRDISHPETERQKTDVLHVLSAIGLDEADLEQKVVEVWNKVDLLPEEPFPDNGVVCVSALTGHGMDGLLRRLARQHTASWRHYSVTLPLEDGAARAWLHEHGDVLRGGDEEQVHVKMQEANAARFTKRFTEYALQPGEF